MMIIVFKSCLFKAVLHQSPLLPLLFSTVLALNDYSVDGVEVIVIWVEPELKMTATSACPLSPLVLHTVTGGEEAVQQWHLYLIQCDKLSWPLSIMLTFHIHACMSILPLLLLSLSVSSSTLLFPPLCTSFSYSNSFNSYTHIQKPWLLTWSKCVLGSF